MTNTKSKVLFAVAGFTLSKTNLADVIVADIPDDVWRNFIDQDFKDRKK